MGRHGPKSEGDGGRKQERAAAERRAQTDPEAELARAPGTLRGV
jgi:hypothetical protein